MGAKMSQDQTKAIMENVTQMVKFAYNHGAEDELNKIVRLVKLDLMLEDTECMKAARDRILELIKSRGSRHADHSYQPVIKVQE
jgi:hypothetical protein